MAGSYNIGSLPFFAFPQLFFVALVVVPALIAIYWLRTRCRPVLVSSLLLWLEQKERREGGRHFQRLEAPLLFFLELCALLLILAAAAGPMVPPGHGLAPVVVILDDSYSMLARQPGGETSRNMAVKALESLSSAEHFPLHIMIAGQSTRLLEETVHNSPGFRRSSWKISRQRG